MRISFHPRVFHITALMECPFSLFFLKLFPFTHQNTARMNDKPIWLTEQKVHEVVNKRNNKSASIVM